MRVKNNIELVRDLYGDSLDPQGLQFLDLALLTLDRQFGMIEGLLEYSQLGRSAKELGPVDLKAVAEAVAGNLDSVVQQNQGRFIVGELPIVHGDAVALNQLLQNLPANAFKFRGKEAPVVRLEASCEQDSWRISVSDNGIGIDPKHHKDIFAPFRRIHSRKQYEGFGIGLATCKRIVEQHDGRIWVASEPGKGTSFHFTLQGVAARTAVFAWIEEAPWAWSTSLFPHRRPEFFYSGRLPSPLRASRHFNFPQRQPTTLPVTPLGFLTRYVSAPAGKVGLIATPFAICRKESFEVLWSWQPATYL